MSCIISIRFHSVLWLFSFWLFGAPLSLLTSISFVDTHLLCINIRPFILAHILCVRTYCWRILLTTTVFDFVPLRFWNFCLGFLFLSLQFWNFCPGFYLFRSFCSGNPRLHFLATPQDLLNAFDLRLSINFCRSTTAQCYLHRFC